MSDEPRIPNLRPTQTAVTREAQWSPNPLQERIKARFWRRLDEQSLRLDAETAFRSREHMLELAGTEKIFKWLENPAFAAWFADADYIGDVIGSEVRRSLEKLIQIRDDHDSPAGDVIKASRTLLELADAFPGRKSEVRFIDEQLDGMKDADVRKEMAELDAKLGELDDGQTDKD